jgi:hypothetical protein
MGVMVFAIGILRRRAAGMRTTSLAQMLRARFQAGGAPGMPQQQLAPPQRPMGAGQ